LLWSATGQVSSDLALSQLCGTLRNRRRLGKFKTLIRFNLLLFFLRITINRLLKRSAWSLQSTKRVRNTKLHPSNVSLRIRRCSPRIDHIRDETTRVLIDFLTTYNSVVGFQCSFVLFLHCQCLVIIHTIGQLTIRFCNLARVVRHDGARRLGEIALGVQTWKCWSRDNYLITSRVDLKHELVWYPFATESIYLIELIHFCILSPQKWLRLCCTACAKEL
jgi:hypothetical protein